MKSPDCFNDKTFHMIIIPQKKKKKYNNNNKKITSFTIEIIIKKKIKKNIGIL